MTSKPILITGGAGFIGSHLVDLLEQRGVNYIVLDNLSSGSIKNIPVATSNNSFIKGDVKDRVLIEHLIDSSSIVIHLACNVGVKNVIANPLEAIETNINSLNIIAHNCSLNKIPLIYVSSSLVYSPQQNTNNHFSEDEQTHSLGFHPVSIYVSSKKTGELICEYYRDLMDLKYVIVRPFNMIGIRQRANIGMVVPSFVNSAISHSIINIYGNGKQSRSFSDVKAAVNILWNIIQRKNLFGQIFNLATTEKSITMLELADRIRNILNVPVKINFIPYSEVYGNSFRDIMSRSPSLTKLRQHLPKWEERDLDVMLEEIIVYEKQNVNKAK